VVPYTEVYKGHAEVGKGIEDHFFIYQIFNIRFNNLRCLINGITFSHQH